MKGIVPPVFEELTEEDKVVCIFLRINSCCFPSFF